MVATGRDSFDALLASGASGAVFFDESLRFLALSPELAAGTGVAAGAVIGAAVDDVASSLWSDLAPSLRAVRDSGQARHDLEFTSVAADGHTSARHWNVSLFATGDGPPFGVGAVVRETTDLVMARDTWQILARITDVVSNPSADVLDDVRGIARALIPTLADVVGFVLTGRERVIVHVDPEREARLSRNPHRVFPEGYLQAMVSAGSGGAHIIDPITPEYLESLAQDAEHLEALRDYGAQSLLIVPLMAGTQFLGVLALAFTEVSGRHYASTEIELAEELGARIAQLVERAQLASIADHASSRLELLARLGEAMDTELDVDTRLALLPTLVMPVLADACSVYRLEDGERLRIVATEHVDPDVKALLSTEGAFASRSINEDMPSTRAARTGKPVVMNDIEASFEAAIARSPEELELVQAAHVRSLLCVPLFNADGVFGVLAFAYSKSGRRYGDDDVVLAQEIGRRVSEWMTHAMHFERQRATAAQLQHALLPGEMSRVATVDVAVRYVPGAAEVGIGGDWYDSVVLPDGRVLVAIGDVVGHGIPAAASMGRFRNVIEVHAIEGMSPAEILKRCAMIAHSRPSERDMATALVAVFDPVSGRGQYARAGHLPAMVRRSNGVIELLEGPSGPPLGALASYVYSDVQFEIDRSDVLMLFTDGLVERRGAPIDDGLDLVAAVATDPHEDLEELADRVMSCLTGDGPPADDVALVLARRAPAGEALDLRVAADFSELKRVRAALEAWCRDLGGGCCTPDVLLAVNECVANGIEHGGSSVHMAARRLPDRMRVEVRDSGEWRVFERAGAGPHTERGRGIAICEQLASHMNVASGPMGTVVTLEFVPRPEVADHAE